MLPEAYGGEVMEKPNVSEWHERFKSGREHVESDQRIDRKRSHRTDENIEKLWNVVHSGRRLNVSATAMQLNLDKTQLRA
jgi:transposase